METTHDRVADAAYIRLAEGPSVRTIPVSELVNVDLDEEGRLIGVELLSFSAQAEVGSLRSVAFRDLAEEGRGAEAPAMEVTPGFKVPVGA